MSTHHKVFFDWDKHNQTKCQKHGVSILEIEYMFINQPRVHHDYKHSDLEQRYLAIGTNKNKRYILVAFTNRLIQGHLHIRPISARYMHQKEIDNLS